MKKREYNCFIRIGETSICLYSENDEFTKYIKKWYKEFITEYKEPDIKLSVYEVPKRYLNTIKISNPEEIDIKYNKENNTLYLNSDKFIGEYNVEKKKGKLICNHYLYFNPFLRIIFALVLLKEGGFLVHAAGMVHDGDGYIFPGKSGAGKSTISKLSNEKIILSDELALVKKNKDKFIIHGTPFWGEYEEAKNKFTEIKGIYFLKKDEKNFTKNLSPLIALKMLLPNIFFYGIDKEFTKKIFNLCHEFIESVPSYELHFVPEPSFWRVINAK